MVGPRERLVAFLLISSLLACGGDDATQPVVDPCTAPATITLGQSITATLTTGDCEVDGSFADIYTLTLTAPTTVVIDLTSAAFDASAARRCASSCTKMPVRYCEPTSQNCRSLTVGSTLTQNTSSSFS